MKYDRLCKFCNNIIKLKIQSYYDSLTRYPEFICKLCRKQQTKNNLPKREELFKFCPLCNKKQTYYKISNLNLAIRKNSMCVDCNKKRYEKIRKLEKYIKLCPICKKELKYINRTNYKRSIKENNVCKECIKFIKKYNPKYNPNYNEIACKFIDMLNEKNNWNLKHAKNNNAEEMILWYYPDGYDKERNIVFEYDEPHHYYKDGSLKNKDIKRQMEIIKHINCKFIRYNERDKKLYEIKLKDGICEYCKLG
jgi:hypothetical protein